MAGYGAIIVAGAAALIAAGSAVYSADRGRYAANTQQDALLRQSEYNKRMAEYGEEQRQLELQALYERNAFESQVSQMQEMRYGMLLDMYGMQAEIAGQRYAMDQEIYDWQLATLDWEAGFKEEQAALIEEKGSLARELFGTETAKLMARERARMAASGIDVGIGSPVAVLGQLSDERQFSSDIMKFESDVGAWDKRFEGKQLLNEKNKVKFGEFGSALDYKGTLAEQRYKVGEAGLSAATARIQTGLLANQRNRIGLGSVIDLNKYKTTITYSDVMTQSQSGVYGSAASAATVGGYLNTGAALFNSMSSYYRATGTATNNDNSVNRGGTGLRYGES